MLSFEVNKDVYIHIYLTFISVLVKQFIKSKLTVQFIHRQHTVVIQTVTR